MRRTQLIEALAIIAAAAVTTACGGIGAGQPITHAANSPAAAASSATAAALSARPIDSTPSTPSAQPPRSSTSRLHRTLVTVTVTQQATTRSAESVTVSVPTGTISTPGTTTTTANTTVSAAHRTAKPPSASASSREATGASVSVTAVAGHAPPRLTPQSADFASPKAVAAQYLSVWCYLPVGGQANLNIARAARWVTAAGWADDRSRAIGPATWAEIQDLGITTVCGPVTATLNHEGPETDRRKFVLLSTTRYRIAAGRVIDSDVIAVQRRVLWADDGRWLVDVHVLAG